MKLNRASNKYAVRPCSKLVGDVEVEKASEGEETESRCQPCEGEEEEFGKRTTTAMQSPYKPSPAEVEEHEKTKLPLEVGAATV